MTVEVDLVLLNYDRRWNIDITIDTSMLEELSRTDTKINILYL